jgi:hypothetical protein
MNAVQKLISCLTENKFLFHYNYRLPNNWFYPECRGEITDILCGRITDFLNFTEAGT